MIGRSLARAMDASPLFDTATLSATDGDVMLDYKIAYECHGYLTTMYDIQLLCEGEVIGCLYYLNDPLQGKEEAVFDKWLKYNQYDDKISAFNPLELAHNIIAEHILLEPNRN